MSYPDLETIRRLNCEITTGDEGQRCTFVEAEQRIRAHVEEVRQLIRVLREAGLGTSRLQKLDPLVGDAQFAILIAYFAAGEQGERVGAERARRMIMEARQYGSNALALLAPWLDDDDEE